MTQQYTEPYQIHRLPNGVNATIFPGQSPIESALEIVAKEQFLKETEQMKKRAGHPPMSILVYDEHIVLGIYKQDKTVEVCLRPYHEQTLHYWTEFALSMRLESIHITDYTSDKSLSLRLEARLQQNWIEYNHQTGILQEKKTAPCSIDSALMHLGTGRDLFGIYDTGEGIQVVHAQVQEESVVSPSGELLDGIKSRSGSNTQTYQLSIGAVEEKIAAEHPGALIARQPMRFCSSGCPEKPWACLAVKLERKYAMNHGYFKKEDFDTLDKNSPPAY